MFGECAFYKLIDIYNVFLVMLNIYIYRKGLIDFSFLNTYL